MKTILKNKSSQQFDVNGISAAPTATKTNEKPAVINKANRLLFTTNRGWDLLSLAYSRGKEYIFDMYRSPSVKSSAVMALGLCFTFVGYEYSRAASITLLAAEETGLGSEALPLTVAVGFPSSALVLYLYTKSIKNFGSKMTLRLSNFACIAIFFLMFLFSGKVKGLMAKVMIVCFYAFREIYVSLLSSQQWAFISTTLDRKTSSYLVSFSGIVSIASAVGGCTVVQLVNVGGVRGLLLTTLIAVVLGLICAEVAHQIGDCDRKLTQENKPEASENESAASTSQHQRSDKSKAGFWSDSFNLILKNKVLQILFMEAVTHQFCSNMLNLMFHNGLRHSTEVDEIKAKMVGRFFATVNVLASLLQCFFFPLILSPATLPTVIRFLPFVVLLSVLLGVFYPGTISVMLGFGTIKILEYSCMHSASEMIYMPLGHEFRYVGKELVKFFGQKLGKSVASLSLSLMITKLKLSLMMQSLLGALLTVIWGSTIFVLADYLTQREHQINRVTFSDDVVDGKSPQGSERIRTKSEEVRLSTSRSMPMFELPNDEEEEALFFKDISSSEDQQPEDFFYGHFNEENISSQVNTEDAPFGENNKSEPSEFLLSEKHAVDSVSSLKLRRKPNLREPAAVMEPESVVSADYLTLVFRTLKATPIISMFIPGKLIDSAEKH